MTDKDYRSFAFLVGGILAGVFGLLLPWLFNGPVRLWAVVVGAILVVVGAAAPRVLGPVYKLWMKVGHVMGAINTFILLHLIFFLFLSPFAAVLRLVGRKTAMSRRPNGEKTYRVASTAQTPERMKEIF